jgi:hypothetical protein
MFSLELQSGSASVSVHHVSSFADLMPSASGSARAQRLHWILLVALIFHTNGLRKILIKTKTKNRISASGYCQCNRC